MVQAEPDNIWRIPVYLPYSQPNLTDKIIKNAEKEIGYKLPVEYLELLRQQNGGYIRFSLPELPHRFIKGIGPSDLSLTNFDWQDYKEYVSYQLDGLVPFDGDGHWHLCLDYRENKKKPKVTYIDIESNEERIIADSFSDYLGMLTIEIANQYVLTDITSIDKFLSELSKLLKIKFDPPDMWSKGYPIYRAGLKNKKMPQWIWISPNDVSRGFVRKEDKDYDKLKNLSTGIGKIYSNLPQKSYIISTTDDIRELVINAITKLGYKTTKLVEFYK
jgi:hypothetical protein